MRVVIQLERIGDLVQTVPAIRVLVDGRKPAVVLVRAGMEEWCELLLPRGIAVLPIPSSELERLVEAVRAGVGSAEAKQAATQIVRSLGLGPVTKVINLTWHASGAALARALDCPHTYGPTVSASGERHAGGFWALYPLAAVDAKPAGRVHMTDVRRLLVEEALHEDGPLPPLPAPLPETRAVSTDRQILLVVGAGDRERAWSWQQLAKLAQLLAARGRAVALIGGQDSADDARRIALAAAGTKNFVGRLDPPRLARLIRSAGLAVGADTGPTHLACHLGLPVVMLMAGRAHVWETGPNRPGDIALQNMPIGQSSIGTIPFDLVYESVQALLENVAAPGSRAACRVHVAAGACPADGIGGVVYDGPATAARLTRAILSSLADVRGRRPRWRDIGAMLDTADAVAKTTLLGLERGALVAGKGQQQACAALDQIDKNRLAAAVPALRAAAHAAIEINEIFEPLADLAVVGASVRLAANSFPAATPRQVASWLARLLARVETACRDAHGSCSRRHLART